MSSLCDGVRVALITAVLVTCGCGGYTTVTPHEIPTTVTRDPVATFQQLQGVLQRHGYRMANRDDSSLTIQVFAHVDEGIAGKESYLALQVAPNGAARIWPLGYLVKDGRVHKSLEREMAALEYDLRAVMQPPLMAVAPVGTTATPTLAQPTQGAIPGAYSPWTYATVAAPVQQPVGPAPANTAANGQAVSLIHGDAQRSSYALVVGIERYRDAPAATGAQTDAEEFARVIETTMGVPGAQVHRLFDDRATKTDIEREVEWLRVNVPRGGRAYFYFSGHGAPAAKPGAGELKETPFLVPWDSRPTAIEQTGVPLSWVLGRLKSSAAKETFAFVDSCFSGQAGWHSSPPSGKRPMVPVELAPVSNVLVFSSARATQVSGPDASGNRGLFTKYLVQAIGQGYAEHNGDRNITAGEIVEWVSGRVTSEARQAGRVQEPEVTGARSGEGSLLESVVAYGVSP